MKTRTSAMMIAAIVVSAGCELLDQSCTARPRDQASKVSIDEGVWGHVWRWRGEFWDNCSGTVTPERQWVHIYELVTMADAEEVSPAGFYRNVGTVFVDSVQSDRAGFFQLKLAPGEYSVFVRQQDLLYANRFQRVGDTTLIQPVAVASGTVTKVQLDITYEKTSMNPTERTQQRWAQR